LLQGNTLDEIPFRAAAGVWGSWLGLILCILCLIAQFYVALFPIGGEPNAVAFFQSYLAAPVILVSYIGWKIYKKTRFVRAHEVDLVSGRRDLNLVELKAQEREEQAKWSPMKKYSIDLEILLTILDFIIGFARWVLESSESLDVVYMYLLASWGVFVICLCLNSIVCSEINVKYSLTSDLLL
jgi:hypothetical protein